jgi:hypothetical protein
VIRSRFELAVSGRLSGVKSAGVLGGKSVVGRTRVGGTRFYIRRRNTNAGAGIAARAREQQKERKRERVELFVVTVAKVSKSETENVRS